MRTIGYTCGMCGVVFLLKARFDAHKETEIPAFAARQAELRKIAEQTFLRRQQDIGRLTPAGGMGEGLARGDRGMKHSWKLSDADKDKIAELYGDPSNKVENIALKFGVTNRTVIEIARVRGQPPRRAARKRKVVHA